MRVGDDVGTHDTRDLRHPQSSDDTTPHHTTPDEGHPRPRHQRTPHPPHSTLHTPHSTSTFTLVLALSRSLSLTLLTPPPPLTLHTHPLSNALLGGPLYRSVLAGRLRLPCILTLAITM